MKSSMPDNKKKSYAIITGASRGIGFYTAKLFLKKAYSVINISRSECLLPGVLNWLVDLSDSKSIDEIKIKLSKKMKDEKNIFCLVHNAMRLWRDDVSSLDVNELRHLLELGLIAPIRLNQLFLPCMAEGSSVIYIGSTLSEKAIPNTASYVIQKHAVAGLMRSSCQDWVGSGIHTACICPGFTDTAMLQDHVGLISLEKIAERTAAKRLITPKEVARLIYFCAKNPIINGSLIHAHLGQLES